MLSEIRHNTFLCNFRDCHLVLSWLLNSKNVLNLTVDDPWINLYRPTSIRSALVRLSSSDHNVVFASLCSYGISLRSGIMRVNLLWDFELFQSVLSLQYCRDARLPKAQEWRTTPNDGGASLIALYLSMPRDRNDHLMTTCSHSPQFIEFWPLPPANHVPGKVT